MRSSARFVLLISLVAANHAARADEPAELRGAIVRGLAVVERAAANYPSNRDCFSCHHQTLPMLAAVSARERGLASPDEMLATQAEFTHESFASRIDDLRQGRNIGGRAMTVSYGLLTLELGGQPPDELTEAMVTFLLKTQEPDGQWITQARRPPMEESTLACTALSLHGLRRYAAPPQRAEAEAAIQRGVAWITEAKAVRQEDRVARLWALSEAGACPLDIDEARREVLAAQRFDGGWPPRDDIGSDAYATGQTLTILALTGTPPDDPAFRRGVAYLLLTQEADGSWFVATRARPVQVFFDNGDPHGRSQFISVPATAWAVAALAQAAPRP
jgi:N-acyl-D-amino-acid deacylase